MLRQGALCGGGVDFISVEPHRQLAPAQRRPGGAQLISSKEDAKTIFRYLRAVVEDGAGCAELTALDDESYTHDRAPLPSVCGREGRSTRHPR